jgi:hypothetical protein
MNIIPVTISQIKERPYNQELRDSFKPIIFITIGLEKLPFIDLFEIDRDNNKSMGIDLIGYDRPPLTLPISIESYPAFEDCIGMVYSLTSHDCLLALKLFIEDSGIENSQIQWIHPDLEKTLLDELGNPDMPQLLKTI